MSSSVNEEPSSKASLRLPTPEYDGRSSSGYSTPNAKLNFPNLARSGSVMKSVRKSGYLEIRFVVCSLTVPTTAPAVVIEAKLHNPRNLATCAFHPLKYFDTFSGEGILSPNHFRFRAALAKLIANDLAYVRPVTMPSSGIYERRLWSAVTPPSTAVRLNLHVHDLRESTLVCYPYFDSPSIFARILDKDIGGHFSIQPLADAVHTKQQYLPNSAIISTKFLADEGVCTITDFMPRPTPSSKGDKPLLPWIVRRAEVIRGTLDFRLECFPAFDYARKEHETRIMDDTNAAKIPQSNEYRKKAVFKGDGMVMELRAMTGCNPDLALSDGADSLPTINFKQDTTTWPRHKGPGIVSEFTLTEGQTADFVFREDPQSQGMVAGVPETPTSFVNKAPVQDRDGARVVSKMFNLAEVDPFFNADTIAKMQESTVAYWYSWILQSKYQGRWREFVHRSAITLKLLTFELTGAIVAAPTFSLPEGTNGEGRNWDYRFSWIRDASFTVYALIRLGFTAEATAYMEFIQSRISTSEGDKPLQIVFGIRGETDLTELELPHLEGYKGQRPVRIGNGAADHLQLDVYGELMDAVYLSSKLAKPCSWELWKSVRRIVDYVYMNYNQPDMSIWEVRNQKQHFVYSKIMMWVALDRGLRLADKRSLPCPKRNEWRAARDTLYEEIMEKGYNEEKGFFCQSYENRDCLDASILVMPLVFFISPVDPRFLSTLNAILKTPERGGLTANHLVYRYDVTKVDDGVGGEEGAFLLCACWAVEALTRAGQHDSEMLAKARVIFEDLVGYSNHVGLFSEEISKDGSALGNMPQAFTHIAMISAAFNLNRVLGRMPVGE